MPKPKFTKTVVLSESLIEWLDEQSKRLEIPVSQILRSILRDAKEGKTWHDHE